MQSTIENSSEAVLAFLQGIPMSARTVKYYRSCILGRPECLEAMLGSVIGISPNGAGGDLGRMNIQSDDGLEYNLKIHDTPPI